MELDYDRDALIFLDYDRLVVVEGYDPSLDTKTYAIVSSFQPVWSLSSGGGGGSRVELDESVRRDAEDAHTRGVRRQRHAVGVSWARAQGVTGEENVQAQAPLFLL